MVKRQRTQSSSDSASLNGSPQTLGESSSGGPLTPLTAADEHGSKVQHIDDHLTAKWKPVIKCHLPPHETQSFLLYDDYDTHYQKHHTNRCLECNRNFPSEHYLLLHIAENHDPLNEAKRERGEKTFACFVENCEKICLTPQRRRWHVTAKHQFPRNYDFFIVNDGIDKRSSMLRPTTRRSRTNSRANARDGDHEYIPPPVKPSKTDNESHMDTESKSTMDNSQLSHSTKVDVEGMTESFSALRFVPPSVRFGRGKGKGGLARS